MVDRLLSFEAVVRRASSFSEARESGGSQHPFDERNIHPEIQALVRALFDDGHYSQATFEAYKYLDKEVDRHSGLGKSGFILMMQAFDPGKPGPILLNHCQSVSEKDEQSGYRFLFAGAMRAIRNPRGHEINVDTPDTCLDHLAFASLLFRRLEDAGFACAPMQAGDDDSE